MKKKRKIGVDFDGTIMQYNGYQNGECHGEPISGAIESLWKLHTQGKEPYIFTTRADSEKNIENVRNWLIKHSPDEEVSLFFSKILITNTKQIGTLAYVDDRAIRFDTWDSVKKYFY